MRRLGFFIEGKGALGDYCTKDGTQNTIIKEEDHTSYGGGYYLYFLRCKNGHKWLRVITQYDESPPTLISGWDTEFEEK